jgi:hypothetical protein
MGNSDIFYVHDAKGKPVAAKFMRDETGAYVTDPNTAKATGTHIYDASDKEIPNANAKSYFIVPADYNIENARHYAKSVEKPIHMFLRGTNPVLPDPVEAAISAPAMARIWKDLTRGGSQDQQRTYNGKKKTTFVAAFTDAASFHYGIISAYTGIPKEMAEGLGGEYNVITKRMHKHSHIDTSGPFGLSKVNGHSINAGYSKGVRMAQDDNEQKTHPHVKMVDNLILSPEDKKKADAIKGHLNNAGVTEVRMASDSPIPMAPGAPGSRSLA